MANLAWAWLLLLWASQLVQSSEVEDFQSHFLVPDGKKGNFEETFYNGDTIDIQWAGWSSDWITQNMNGNSKANLYVVAWDASVSSFFRPIASSIDITTSGHHSWKINIGSDDLAKTNSYSFTFIPEEDSYSADSPQIYSNGFYIRNKPKTSTASTASATSTASASAGSPASTSSGGGLSTGAKIGIGVGVGVGGFLVVALLVFWLWSRKRKQEPSEQTHKEALPVVQMSESSQPSELGAAARLAEMQTSQSDRAELEERNKIPPQELDGGDTHLPSGAKP